MKLRGVSLLDGLRRAVDAIAGLFSDALAFQCEGCELLDTLRHVIVCKESGSCDETVGASCGAFADGFLGGLDSSVHLDVNIQVTVYDPLANLLDLVRHSWDIGLSAESWVDSHDQSVVDQVQDILDHLGRGVRVEGNRWRSAGCADVGKSAVQVGAGLHVDDDDAWLSVWSLRDFHELIEHGICALFADHELRLERQSRVLTTPPDCVWPERQVWNEVSVHDIELDAVAASVFQGLAVGAELSEISRKDGWDDLHLARFAVQVQCCR
mmetsp:Transcript_13002/g.35872  ORF Transcript_13002/g.35872 Transcript_13002/m.35872 type:complete len:268 (-) Transcript_13002:284-1087(-)